MTTNKLRVILDANVFVSYLLDPASDRATARLARAGLDGVFVLLVPDRLMDELAAVVARKPYLAARIDPTTLVTLIQLVSTYAERIVMPPAPPPPIARDPDDDYLLTAAMIGHADYLVTGDADLLTLAGLVPVAIVSPAAFVQVLAEQGV